MYADAHGVGQAFRLLGGVYLVLLPPLIWLFLKHRQVARASN
jgi:hypothetical protein